MEIFNSINKKDNLILALGYFDGIHIGHKKIISTLIQMSKEKGLKSALITFKKNPTNYFSKIKIPSIQTTEQRREMLSDIGLDYLYELDFDNYKDLNAGDYLENILIKNLKPKIIIAGYNHTFGKNRSGNSEFLKENAEKYGYEAIIIPKQEYKNQKVSSSSIRQKIQKGELEDIEAMLDREYSIEGIVVEGDKIARNLGYKTANTIWDNSLAKLPYGVYFGFCEIKSTKLLKPALISWGNKPTLFESKKEILETHIYDFDEDIYGEKIKVIFKKKLRDEKKFSGINTLKNQIDSDYQDFIQWSCAF